MSDRNPVESHYGHESIRPRVTDALAAAGLGHGLIDWRELASLDQFHVGGLTATTELAARLDPADGATILDVGSGIGGAARYLAAMYGARVAGIDLTAAFVDVASMLSERTGLSDRTTFQRADALDLPFAGASFDAAWTQHVAMNIADRDRLYGEIRRVLKPRARFAISDVLAGDGGDVIFPVPWARTPATSFLLTANEMRNALSNAGFREVTWADTTDATIAQSRQQQAPSKTPSPLTIQSVMAPDFPTMGANLFRNRVEGRVRIVQAVFEAI